MKEVVDAINYGACKEVVFALLRKNNIKYEYKRLCFLYPNNYIVFNNQKFTNI